MAAGSLGSWAKRRPAGLGPGWRSVAGAVLSAALAMAASVGPAAGQVAAHELYKLPEVHRPLAVAYLAGRYTDKEALTGAWNIAPQGGASLFARFPTLTGSGGDGIPIIFFNAPPPFREDTRLSKTGNVLALGGKTPLELKLYFFMEEPLVSSLKTLRIRAFQSDNWPRKQPADVFSLLLDTTFVIEGQRLGIFAGDKLTPEKDIACINKRSVTDPRHGPPCELSRDEATGEVEVTGEVIEDPLSGHPALFAKARKALGGPPTSWLKEVPTDICVVGDAQRLPRIFIPIDARRYDEIPLDKQRDGRFCRRVENLDFILVREKGIRIEGRETGAQDALVKTRLDSLTESADTWKMLAVAPKQGAQQIVLYPPASSTPTADAPKLPPSPAPVTPSSFEVLISGQVAAGSIRKLWYRPLPAGVDANATCEMPVLSPTTGKWGSGDLILAAKLKPKEKAPDRLIATEPDDRRVKLKHQRLELIADAGGRAYCGVATPVLGLERQFLVKLHLPPAPEKTAAVKETVKEKAVPTKEPAKEKVVPSKEPAKEKVVPQPSVAKKPGPPVKVIFGGANPELMDQLSHASKIVNEQGVFEGVDSNQLRFTLPGGTSHRISACNVDRQPLLQCGPDADGQSLEIVPKQRTAVIPKLLRVNVVFAPRSITLVFQADGPAAVRIQKLSDGKPAPAVRLEGGRSREVELDWKLGDKIKVSLEDAALHRVTAATLEQKVPLDLENDKQFEIPIKLELNGKAVSITTKDRLFSGTLSVTARGGEIYVWHGEKNLGLVGAGPKKEVEVKGAKHRDNLSVQVADPEYEVAKLSLSDGQRQIVLEGAALKTQRATFTLDRNHLRSSDKGDDLAALHLEADLKLTDVPLPTEVLLKPAVLLGKRLLPLQSCKVTLAKAEATFVQKKDHTLATFGKDKRMPKRGSYAVEVAQGQDASTVCRGLEPEGRVAASKLEKLGPDRTLSVPLKRPGSRAFVGIVSLSKEVRSKQKNWKAALEALRNAFDAGVREGKYIWGAIYGPDGKALTRTETADYAPLDIDSAILDSAPTMERLKDGTRLVPFDTLVDLTAKDVADFESNVDVLIVAETVRTTCGWSSPPFVQGSRSALVRIASFSGKQGTKLIEGVRRCDKTDRSEKAGVVAEVEVVPEDADTATGATPDMQLTKAIGEVAKSFPKQR